MTGLLDSLDDDTLREWNDNETIPKWVDITECRLDQFYTDKDIARSCYDRLIMFLDERGVADNVFFVEPSAGNGSFSDLLDSDASIAMDLEPMSDRIMRCDYLTWVPDVPGDKTIVAIGNPPFGERAWMALAFMNKTAEYADYCGFILPMYFDSDGKGTPKYRVNGMRLVSSIELPDDSFTTPYDDRRHKLGTVFHVWEKGENKRPDYSSVDARFEVSTVCDSKDRVCGQAFKEEADMFIASSFFPGKIIVATKVWGDVLYGSGYGVRALDESDRRKLIETMGSTNWNAHSSCATHGCRHIGMPQIKSVIAEAFGIGVST